MTQVESELLYSIKLLLMIQDGSAIHQSVEELDDALRKAQRRGVEVLCLTKSEKLEIVSAVIAAEMLAGTFDWLTDEFKEARDEYLGILRRKGVPEHLLAAARAIEYGDVLSES